MRTAVSRIFIGLLLVLGFAHAQDTIADALRLDDDLSTIRTLLETDPRVTDLLEGQGVVTVFAPENEVFTNFTGGALDRFFGASDVTVGFVENYVLPGPYTVEVLLALLQERGDQMTLPTVGGKGMSFTLFEGRIIVINGIAVITREGAVTGTGVLHTIGITLPSDTVERDDN